MTSSTKIATSKVLRYSVLFGGFFASYHGTRKALNLYVQQPPENNVALASIMVLSPLVILPSLRPLIPYGIMLIGIDAINGIDDI